MNTTILEREIKLRFNSADEARMRSSRPAPPPSTAGGCRKTPSSTPKMSSCGVSDVCFGYRMETAKAG